MKKIYIYLFSITALLLSSTVVSQAQSSTPGKSPDGVVMKKVVTPGSEPNTYTIDLEAFVTGESITQEVVTSAPCDFLLILDYSSSMTSDYEGNGPFTYPYRTVYTYNDVTSSTKYTFNGTQYSVYTQRSNEGKSLNQNRCNWAYIVVGSKRYYLTLDGSAIEAVSNGNMAGDMDNPDNWPKGVNGEKIYPAAGTGRPLYAEITMKTTTTKSRQFALLDAVSNFIDIVNADAKENNVEHRIGIVDFENDKYPRFEAPNSSDAPKYITSSWYNYLRPVEGFGGSSSSPLMAAYSSNLTTKYVDDVNSTAVLKHFTSVNDQSVVGIKGSLALMDVGGSTATDRGMVLGKLLFDAEKRSDENVGKVVIVFSDGNPENKGGEDDNYKKQCSNNAIAEAKKLKDAGYKVYSIGVLGNNPKDFNLQTLNAISSNYPDATKYSDASKTDTGDGYFKNVTGGDLSDVFASIASSEMTGGADYKLEKTSTTVIDVVSPAFKLPDGATGANITLQVAKCIGVQPTGPDGKYVYTFDNPIDIGPFGELFTDAVAKVGDFDTTTKTFTEAAGGKTVQVSNFGFSENWVGPRTEGGETSYDGYKLIISFPIEIDPRNPGGANVATNTEDSGIYTDKGDGTGYQQIGGFEIPHAKIPNLVVLKYGLHMGESATFRVINKDTNEPYPIVLVATQKSDDPTVPCIARVKIQKPGRYEVVETSWSWAYELTTRDSSYDVDDATTGPATSTETWNELGYGDPGAGYQASIPTVFGTVVPENTTSIIRNVNDLTEDPTYSGTLFIFRDTMKSNLPAHAEAMKNNEFYKAN